MSDMEVALAAKELAMIIIVRRPRSLKMSRESLSNANMTDQSIKMEHWRLIMRSFYEV